MNTRRQLMHKVASAGALALAITLGAHAASAQAYSYPSLQLPTVSNRDYTAALVASKGTVALFQWREGINDNLHFGLDAGFGDPEGGSNSLIAFGGVSIAGQLLRATKDQPLDLLLTGGFGLAVGSGQTTVRMPAGVSLGHRFAFAGGMALTPYMHPRVSLDLCTSCGPHNNDNSELSLNFDMGVNFEVTPRFGLRMAGSFSGSDYVGRNDSFAVGINWIPVPLTRK